MKLHAISKKSLGSRLAGRLKISPDLENPAKILEIHGNSMEILPKSIKSSKNPRDSRSEAAQIPEARLASRHTRMLGNAENDEVPGFFRSSKPHVLEPLFLNSGRSQSLRISGPHPLSSSASQHLSSLPSLREPGRSF